jgi:hypothetical protein
MWQVYKRPTSASDFFAILSLLEILIALWCVCMWVGKAFLLKQWCQHTFELKNELVYCTREWRLLWDNVEKFASKLPRVLSNTALLQFNTPPTTRFFLKSGMRKYIVCLQYCLYQLMLGGIINQWIEEIFLFHFQ